MAKGSDPSAQAPGGAVGGLPPSPQSLRQSSPDLAFLEDAQPPRGGGFGRIILAFFVVVLLGGLGAGAYYAYAVLPKTVFGMYAAKLVVAKQAVYSSSADFHSDDPSLQNYKANISASGAYDFANPDSPKLDLKLESSVGDGNVKGELRTLEKKVYFQITAFKVPGFDIKVPADWYFYDYSKDQVAKDECTNGDKTAAARDAFIKNLPLTNTKLVKPYERINGHATAHFSGSVDLSHMQSAIDAANKELPSSCKINSSPDDYKDTDLSYDLWKGLDFDRLKLSLSTKQPKADQAVPSTSQSVSTPVATSSTAKFNSYLTLQLDTSSYNKPVDVKAPDNPKDVQTLIDAVLGDLSGTASTPQASRDAQRKADLRTVQAGLEEYFADNNVYPSGTYAGLSKILVPKYLKSLPSDPTAGKSYVYTPGPAGCKTKCSSFALSAGLEDSSDSNYPSYKITSLN